MGDRRSTVSYEWDACTNGNATGCTVRVPSGSTTTYTPTGADVGLYLIAFVTHTNSVSSAVQGIGTSDFGYSPLAP